MRTPPAVTVSKQPICMHITLPSSSFASAAPWRRVISGCWGRRLTPDGAECLSLCPVTSSIYHQLGPSSHWRPAVLAYPPSIIISLMGWQWQAIIARTAGHCTGRPTLRWSNYVAQSRVRPTAASPAGGATAATTCERAAQSLALNVTTYFVLYFVPLLRVRCYTRSSITYSEPLLQSGTLLMSTPVQLIRFWHLKPSLKWTV